MTELKNQVIWITGASSGLGEAMAYALARKGARLILSARRKEELDRVKGNCPEEMQANIRVIPLDLGEPSALRLCTEAALQVFGHIDMLINNGGISQRGYGRETPIENDRRIMEVNFFGAIAITKYLLPHFIERKKGHIVTITSLVGHIGTPSRTAYAASKHALHGFFESLRAELWREYKNAIQITLICPGYVKTNVTYNSLNFDGGSYGKMDDLHSKAMTPDQFAVKAIRAIEKKKDEVYIGGKEVLGVYLMRFFPAIFRRVVRKVKVT
jgi:short-subunit dehydrogenase